ncbi:MAG TPA: fused MFS/spermidine synthase [Candidatus Xenobia bacterium]|nr:fused MFS/spermidine synthase [Candidatus Xenobia bacterium]
MHWYFIFFLLSGFCSLVYEVVWLRLAMAQFGVITPLVSVVLSVFMAGLGLGSWLAGRLMAALGAPAPAVPLRLYALVELFIGVSGLLVPRLLRSGHALLVEAGGDAGWGSPEYFLGATLWITLALLPACTCMGATFPLAMAAIERSAGLRTAQSFSYLYVANVLGAALGTAVPAFVLVEALGFLGTSLVAVVLNFLLAAAALGLSRGRQSQVAAALPAEPPPAPHSSDTPAGDTLWLLFTTGVVSLALEVVWIRLYTPYIGTVVYAFAAILILYLLGTFLGSRLYRATPTAALPARAATAWLLAGVFAALALACADPRFGQPGFLRGLLRVFMAVLPFSAAVGFLTPMLVDRWSAGDPRRAGRAYALNVLGSIVGPLLAGFALLPWLGERWSVVLLTVPLLALGWRVTRGPGAVPAFSVRAALLLPLVLLVVARTYEEKFTPREVRRDYAATVTAVGTGMERRLLVNGTSMTILTPITKMMAHLPAASLPRAPQNALVICFGMGTSHRSLLSWDIPVTSVELIPSVPELFGYFHADGAALLASPRSRIVIDDGRRFLERTPEQFDVITIDPPPPVEAAGSSLLYSREFYSALKKRLRPGGLLQQWIPYGDPATKAAVARALRESFPYVRVFERRPGWEYHFLASLEPIPARSAAELAQRLPPAAAADLVEWGPQPTPEEQFAFILSREIPLEQLLLLAPRAPALQDDRPINEYYLLRRQLGVLTYAE